MSDATAPASTLPAINSSLIMHQAWFQFTTSLPRTAHVWGIAFLLSLGFAFPPAVVDRYRASAFGWVLLILCGKLCAEAAAMRGLLRDRIWLWMPNGDLWKYLGVNLFLALPLLGIAVIGDLMSGTMTLGVLLALPVALLLLQYWLWPIGLLIGYREMTAKESARLMNGRMTSMIGALFMCLFPIVLLFGTAEFMFPHSIAWTRLCTVLRLWSGSTATTALWAAMYKLTAERAG